MSLVIRPGPLVTQPQHAAQIDYAGLAKGVRILFNPGVGPFDLVTGRSWTPGGNAAIATGQNGKVFSFDGEDDFYACDGYPELTGNIGTFFAWCPMVGAGDVNGHVLFGTSSPNVSAYEIYPDLRVSVGSNNPSSAGLSSWFNTKNRSIVFASGGTAQTCRVFLDGKETGLTWTAAPVAWGPGNKNFNLGRYIGGAFRDFNGTILVAGYTDAIWGEAEARAFRENPWQLFKTRAEKWWTVAGAKHDLTSAASTQANNGSAAVITQGHILVGSQLAQAGTGRAGKIEQKHLVVAQSSAQANASSAASITIGRSLAGATGVQANTFSASAIAQTHVLPVAAAAQANTSSAAGITETHVLVATSATQDNMSSTGAISIGSDRLMPGLPMQANTAGVEAISQTHILVVASSGQGNRAITGSISDGIVVETVLVTGGAAAPRIKKPGIPAGTPEWLKTMVEILTGRRGNRIAVPRFQTLTFSPNPTRAECEALYAYTNEVRSAVETIITRLDS
ncbi:hypothetical protein [Nitrosovibrio sp. Nv6]|uniref:hypothetical protein n=1 Tax=Nitrosovibrio sp. Nv6 TaxID=1855340 RepID=UPI0008AD1681|nr:hypothetical protein [Nitrosovibrio sp. Nv6]SEO52438.1 hypothetical protein SAMN05216316_0411 [Nitrosovibrio sp. Nv6]